MLSTSRVLVRLPCTALAAVACLLALVLRPGSGRADQWGPFTPVHHSADRQFRLRIAWDFGGPKPRLAFDRQGPQGFQNLWTIDSPQEHPPIEVHFAPDGSAVVLVDQWGGTGFGKVLAFLDGQGKPGRSYELNEIISEDERLYAGRSISSIDWRLANSGFFRSQGRQFVFLTAAGSTRAYRLPGGEPISLTTAAEREIWRERAAFLRPGLTSKSIDTRSDAAHLLGFLRDSASVPALRKLLSDPSWDTVSVSSNPSMPNGSYKSYSLQDTAGRALHRILGDEAVPLFEAKLRTANAYMRPTWMWLITESGGPKARVVCRRLARGRPGLLRVEAVKALLEVNDGDYARRHPELVRSRDSQVRCLSAAMLSEFARPSDSGTLRQAVGSKDTTVGLWAYRGLLRVDPARAEPMRPRLSKEIAAWIAYDRKAQEEERLQPPTRAEQLDWVTALRRHTHTRIYWGAEEREANWLCRRLVRERPPGLEAALREAALCPCSEIRRITSAALAVLGDPQARAELDRWCRSPEPYYRSDSLQWRALCRAGAGGRAEPRSLRPAS